jgi:hypothetical protein
MGGVMLKRFLPAAALALLLASASGCFMSPRAAAGLGRAALFAAVVATDVMILASHDAHYHSFGCGHHHAYRDGRWVYYYEDRWEYHEGGSWHAYVD